jgi:hypothetical protein
MQEWELMVNRGWEFAMRVVGVYRKFQKLQEPPPSLVVVNEVLKAVLGIGMNLAEADGEGIYFREMRWKAVNFCEEALYWIKLMRRTRYISLPYDHYAVLSAACEKLLRMLSAKPEQGDVEGETAAGQE